MEEPCLNPATLLKIKHHILLRNFTSPLDNSSLAHDGKKFHLETRSPFNQDHLLVPFTLNLVIKLL